MLILKRLFYLGMLFAVLPVAAMAQANSGTQSDNQEMTVEQSYLQETVEMMVIREQSQLNDRDNKMVALEYIASAINRGSKREELHTTLDYLSLEGILYVTRESGKVTNNFPDVRWQAARYLGQLGTPEAKETLIKMVNSDNDILVISEAMRALGVIGNNDNDQVSSIIAWTMDRLDGVVTDNYLALSALDAFEKIAAANGGLRDPLAYEIIMRISVNYKYVQPVRSRARSLLESLMKNLNQQS